jgi:hypothetical protein|nr:MAG TPA: hypothetical protein [Caudoviricetes sp.]DAU65262.1 MAG TPA: hypothetical protein [Caudoviricetes sp.]
MLTAKQDKWVVKCIENTIKTLDTETHKEVIEELENIKKNFTEGSVTRLEFKMSHEDLKEIDECLEQLEEISKYYSSVLDIHITQEYDKIKKAMTPLLEYLATLKDTVNNDVSFNEDLLKKEIKAEVIQLLSEEKGISVTQSEKLVYTDPRYSKEFRRLRIYNDYANITKTKYDFYLRVLTNVTQSVSTASKESVNSRMSGNA